MSSVVKESRINPILDFLQHTKYEHLVAGITAGLTSTLILHPLDVVKIRFAVNDGVVKLPMYAGISNAFKTIVKTEGVAGLYKGVTPNLAGAGASWGLYFFFYNTLKTWFKDGNAQTQLTTFQHMIAASEAGICTLFITNPLWVIKTRLCLQVEEKTYKGLIGGFRQVYKTDGFKGFYKGFVPGIFGVSHGVIQFVVYEEFKDIHNKYYNYAPDKKLSSVAYLSFAAASKLIAAATTYPYQVVRLRLQQHNTAYSGVIMCITRTWRHEGWLGFYKGLGPNLLRVVPATMITFLTYENLSHYLMTKK